MNLFDVDFKSATLGMMTHCLILLPKDSQNFATLYLLHGLSDDEESWLRRTGIEVYAEKRNLAVVMPTTHRGWYTDTQYGMDYFTFLTEELPSFCRETFRGMSCRREDTFIAGLSMGGYGALKATLARPDLYCAGAGLSSATDVVRRSERGTDERQKRYWQSLFGADRDEVEKGTDNLYTLAARCKEKADAGEVSLPKLYQWCGTEDSLLEENRALKTALTDLGFDLTYSESDGNHSWPYWDREIRGVLQWMDGIRA